MRFHEGAHARSRMTFSLCVNSMALSGLQAFDLAPGELGERPCPATHLERLLAAVPDSARAMIPCMIAASRNMLNAM